MPKGFTGNLNGRPKKGTSLTEFLREAFEEARNIEGRDDPITTKRLVAEYLRGAVTKGEVELVTGVIFKFTPETWMDTIKWVTARMDGNPVQPIDGNMTTSLLFDAMGTVERDYLPQGEVIDVTEKVEVELVKPI